MTNENLLAELIKSGGIVAFAVVMLLTVKSLPAVVQAIRGGGKSSNGIISEDRMKSLLRESQDDIIAEVRKQGHDMRNVAMAAIAEADRRTRDPRA